jgi:hypothetical protein
LLPFRTIFIPVVVVQLAVAFTDDLSNYTTEFTFVDPEFLAGSGGLTSCVRPDVFSTTE